MRPTSLITLVISVLSVLSNNASAMTANQSGEWDSVSVGRSGLLVRGSRDAITYNDDRSILWGATVIGQCPYTADYKEDSRVHVSPTSPKKELFVVLCWEDHRGGKAAWVVDSKNRTVLAKNIVPKGWGIAPWTSWSPDEDFALFLAVGEVTMGDMVFTSLTSGRSQEIHFKNFTRDENTELQDFDPDALAWAGPTSFRLKIDVHCNPCELGDERCDREKVLRSQPALVNLSPFGIGYGVVKAERARRRETPPLDLEKYVDRDLNDLLREVPGMERRLRVLLGRNYNLFMNNLTVSAALENKQGYLGMHGLAPHMGTVEEAVILISLSNQKIHCAILSRRFGRRYRVFSEDPGGAPTALMDQLIYR